MIVRNLEQAKVYLPSVNTLVANDRLDDFFRRAQEWVSEKIIGPDIEGTLEISQVTGQPDPHARLRTIVSRIICESAYLTAIAEMDLQLSEAGFVVQSNQMVSPASQQRMDRLVNSLKQRMVTDCDDMVRYMIKNSRHHDAYDDWRGTEQYNYLTQAFTPTMEEALQSCLRGDDAPTEWPDFCNLQPEMAQALLNVAAPYVSQEELERLLELYRDGETLYVHNRAIGHLRRVAVKETMGDHAGAVKAAIQARKVMTANESAFPAFAASDRRTLDTVDFGNGPSMNCL